MFYHSSYPPPSISFTTSCTCTPVPPTWIKLYPKIYHDIPLFHSSQQFVPTHAANLLLLFSKSYQHPLADTLFVWKFKLRNFICIWLKSWNKIYSWIFIFNGNENSYLKFCAPVTIQIWRKHRPASRNMLRPGMFCQSWVVKWLHLLHKTLGF